MQNDCQILNTTLDGSIQFPAHIGHGNTNQSLIDTAYSGIKDPAVHLPQYFMDFTILCGCNDDVDEINNLLIDQLPGQLKEFNSADRQVIAQRVDISTAGYLMEYLNTIVTSGMPLSKLRLKISCPLILLHY